LGRDPRYDLLFLFQPIRIGPVNAKNRFYQVPHLVWVMQNRVPTPQCGESRPKAAGQLFASSTERRAMTRLFT